MFSPPYIHCEKICPNTGDEIYLRLILWMDFFFFLRGSETGKARGFFQQGISDKISYNNGCKYLVDKTLFYIWVKTNFNMLIKKHKSVSL